ncbi:MAG TPA: LacI family DNA-binding transcriptional regulator [Chthonomonadaceae bacterium]|nr:LacI family DNA-binding transcriptional regulator [Chthonomonadaceae bacterium]
MADSTPPTIRDLARELNVSHTTVSRVLNGKGGAFISDATRRRVLDAAARRNYRPHRFARALATGRTGMVVLWAQTLRQPYAVNIMNQVLDQMSDPSCELVIRTMRQLDAYPYGIAHWQVDGILALDGVDVLQHVMVLGQGSGPPIVAMGDPPGIPVDHVGVDLRAGAVEATRHLIEAGCRRIAFFTNTWGNRPDEGRYAGYLSVMREAGRAPEIIVLTGEKRASARVALRTYIEREGHPDGLLCLSDDIAIGAYSAIRDLHLRIPDDIAVVGCDGLEEDEYLEPPLTTIMQPFDQMAAVAWQFLRQRMENRSLPIQTCVLSPQLVVRASSQH